MAYLLAELRYTVFFLVVIITRHNDGDCSINNIRIADVDVVNHAFVIYLHYFLEVLI